MALDNLKARYLSNENSFYREYYYYFLHSFMALIVLMILATGFVLYQVLHIPLPVFDARQQDGNVLVLTPFTEPNMLPSTIMQWASKAATAAYTFDFYNYNQQIARVRPYFTEAGWQDYLASVNNLISTIVQRQLFVNGVVSGTPVISNQGPLPGKGYVWRVQIPFLVTYQSANGIEKRNYYVMISIVQVPTEVNPQGIGIDQFVMR